MLATAMLARTGGTIVQLSAWSLTMSLCDEVAFPVLYIICAGRDLPLQQCAW
jgi:hypothetical protein